MPPRDSILARLYVALVLLALVPLVVLGQVVRIILTEGEALREQGESQASGHVEIPAFRGAILDRAGRTLAAHIAHFDLALDPTVPGFDAEAERLYATLASFTGTPARSYRRMVARRASPQYIRLRRNLTEVEKEQVEALEVPGVILKARYARRYTYGQAAAHVIGHADPDGAGRAGLELLYDDVLRGTPGSRAVRLDRRERIKAFAGGAVVQPHHGQTLVLTLDLVRQALMEEELARGVAESGAKSGTAIAMDPQTGAILALANVPTYDPNRPGAFSAESRRNRAITDRYEPGSTFKMVTAAAAVDQGVVAMDDTLDTGTGWKVFSGRTMHDSHGYGRISFTDVIAKSSNVGTATVAMRMEPGVLYQYARNLGYGQPTTIDLPGEVAGTLKRPDRWSGTTQAWMSHGYEIDATPLQVLVSYAALANGGLVVQPHVVQERRSPSGDVLWTAADGARGRADATTTASPDIRRRAHPDSIRRAFSRATARTLRPAFEKVLEDGGTAERARVEGLRIAGKTGTAQTATGGSYARRTYRASFAGFFPADDPQVVMLIMLDAPTTSGYGGVVAAPIFQRIASRWVGTFPEIAARMAPPDTLARLGVLPLPDVTGLPEVIAAQRLRAEGFAARTAPSRAPMRTVAATSPRAGERLAPGTPISFTTNTTVPNASPQEGAPVSASQAGASFPPPGSTSPEAGASPALMPDLVGLSARQATLWLRAQGTDVTLSGSGTVTAQSPAPGSALGTAATLTCD